VPSALPDDIRRFLLVAVPSVPHLEALLLLHEEPRPWTSPSLASRLYVPAETAEGLLQDLVERHLALRAGDAFTYGPTDAAKREVIGRLAELYARNVVEVAQLIHAKTDQAAQRFADAFRLRRED
jgi:hypothetical protein